MTAKVSKIGNLQIRVPFKNGLRNGCGYVRYDEASQEVFVFRDAEHRLALTVEQTRSLQSALQELFTTMAQQGVIK